ncbi:endonuclease V-like protein UPF0215 family [Halarchaeum rubridurum]|uniref:UPF0215 protein GCM10009017_04690 n=1 Tax=Halarchaeum rubridurum TaxID=489911 RepID=A0A830FTI9_9EURY|nr:DUF99 family protein [Halarchaeum rubridurum]MBP1954132.1 endonuclease V-like protein UPF0215 family [Halarchaeum rubridurum]GGM57580.1 hypothetical protein GCM10009017_04690 [Halarchaeum rubridurum]
MKGGTRALGLAESYVGEAGRSTLAGAVVRADRVVDDFRFSACTVGGNDATDAIVELWRGLDRPDVRHVLVAGVALAWYNVLDLQRLHDATDRPVLAVSFEASAGLDEAIRREFDGDAADERLAAYRALPERRPVAVNDDTVYVRSVGCDDPARVVRAHTPEGGRPEPLRVAREAARAADRYRCPTDR